MGEELQRSIETVLKGTSSKTSVAIKLLSQMIDDKFSKSENHSARRHYELLKAIQNQNKEFIDFKDATSKKFEGLAVVSFFSTHRRLFWVIAIATFILIGSGAQNILVTLIK